MLKVCIICSEEKDLTNYRTSKINASGIRNECRSCENNREASRRAAKRKEVSDYKVKMGCKICGYNKIPFALHLNHRDPTTKRGDTAGNHAYRTTWPMARIWAELEKCDVLCANCHAEHTYKHQHYR